MGLTFNLPSLFLTAHCLTWRFRQPLFLLPLSLFFSFSLACSIDYLSPGPSHLPLLDFCIPPLFPTLFLLKLPFHEHRPCSREPSRIRIKPLGLKELEPPINQAGGANTALSHSHYYIYLLYRLPVLCLVRDCSLWLCFGSYLFLAVVSLFSLIDWAIYHRRCDLSLSPPFPTSSSFYPFVE